MSADTVDCLLRSRLPDAERLASALDAAAQRGRDDLSDGAAQAAALLDAVEVPEGEAAEALQHLRALCRAILGR